MARQMKRLKKSKREQLFDIILDSLNEMPDLLRQVFVLSHYHGNSSAEIATKFGVREEDVPFLLKRANRLLHQKLNRFRSPAKRTPTG
ncbi:hypothetical protein MYX65_08685 [Acidobacteria bacterium AH-259-L09]|nr:hypothetical protein [Acidobacteria bacterium AH-259-L09]